MGLEDLINSAKTTLKAGCELIIHHPIATGIYTYYATGHELLTRQFQEQDAFAYSLLAGAAAYLCCKLTTDKKTTITSTAIAGLAVGAMNTLEPATLLENVASFLLAYPVPCALLTMHKYQQQLKQSYANKPDNISSTRTAIDYILERPTILASLAGTTAFAIFAEKATFGYNNAPLHALAVNSLVAGTFACGAYFANLALAALFHSQSTRYARLAAKAKLQKIIRKYDAALCTLSQLEKIATPNLQSAIEIEKAECLVKQGKYEEGIIKLTEVLQDTAISDAKHPFELLYEPFRITGVTTLKNVLKFIIETFAPRHTIEKAILSLKEGRPAMAEYLFTSTINAEKQNLDYRVLHLFLLDAIDDKKGACAELKQTVKICSPNDFKKISSTTDEVLEHKGITRTTLFKRGQNSFAQEYSDTRLFRQAMPNQETIAQALAHTQHNGYEYLAIAYVNGIRLFDATITEQDLKKALELLAEATQRANNHCTQERIRTINYPKFLEQKFARRATKSTNLQEKIIEESTMITQYLATCKPTIIHGNPHRKNIIKITNGRLCLIDFGDVCKAHFGMDAEHLITDFGMLADRTTYFEECIKIRDEKGPKREMLKQYAYAAVLKAGQLLGRSIAFSEGSPQVHYANLTRAIKEAASVSDDKIQWGRFYDAVLHLEQEVL